jgi:hypothetical protein
MKAEGHQFSDAAQKVKIKIEFDIGSGVWIAYNNDDAMKKRGYDIRQASWRLRMIPYDHSHDSILERAGYPDWERVEKDILA